MTHNQETNALVKECITSALLEMMKKQSLDEIVITELVRRAGVGRVSFYRNFESKKDVLEQHLKTLLEEWGKEFEALGDPEQFSDSLIRHYYQNRELYLLLYRQGLSGLIYETIRNAMKLEESQNNIERYARSMIAGMIWGWVDEWMRRGMPESPEEFALLTAQSRS